MYRASALEVAIPPNLWFSRPNVGYSSVEYTAASEETAARAAA
jgi:hypothetical protein